MKLKLKENTVIGIYILGFLVVLFILKFTFFPDLFSERHFLNWDAAHYFTIKNEGYQGFLVAFFPLFPLVWKLTHLNVFGIVILNALLYFSSVYFLISKMKLTSLELVLYLSVPSAVFYYLPYSESLFFLSSTLLILGVKNEKFYQVLVGLLLCTLSRPSFTVLLPSLLILEMYDYKDLKYFLSRLVGYISVCLLGIILVAFYQYQFTGNWFEFFSVQQGWGNELQFPKLPLTSWGGNMIVRFDGIALIFGLLSGLFLLFILLKFKKYKNIFLPREIVLSLSYLGGITFMVLIFRGGSLFSLNRFVFAVPFIFLVVKYYLEGSFYFSSKQILFIFILFLFYWLLFGSYVHIQAFLKYVLVSIYLLLFFLIKIRNKKWSRFYLISFISINFIFQVYFFIHFLMSKGSQGWIG